MNSNLPMNKEMSSKTPKNIQRKHVFLYTNNSELMSIMVLEYKSEIQNSCLFESVTSGKRF